MEISSVIASVVGAQLKSVLTKLAGEFGEEIKQLVNNNILEYQEKEYSRNSLTKTLLHRVKPRLLKEFYQPLFLSDSNSQKISTEHIDNIFKASNLITLIGSAGSGKSTIVKYLFMNSIGNYSA